MEKKDKNKQLIKDLFENGYKFKKIGKYEKAIECYKKIIELDPNNFQPWEHLYGIYHKLGEKSKAQECFEKVEELTKKYINQSMTSAFAWYFRKAGDRYFNQKDFDKAIDYYKKALKEDPTDEKSNKQFKMITIRNY